MAACSHLLPNYSPRYFGQSSQVLLHDLRFMYHQSSKRVFDIDLNNRAQLAHDFARSLSVEGVKCTPTVRRTPPKTNHLVSHSISTKKSTEKSKEPIIDAILEFFPVIELNDYTHDQRHYSTKQPYQCPPKTYVLSSPPSGFHPIGVQLLARHGSRTLTKTNYDEQVLQIWNIAREKNMLTAFGEQLENDIELFMAANNQLGRGELTRLGRDEHRGIGTRLYQRLPSLFDKCSSISVMTSGKKRAMDSAQEFFLGLTESMCHIEIAEERTNKKLLYFHKYCPNYLTFKSNDTHVKTKLDLIKNLEQTRIYARQVLRKMYHDEFIQCLINGGCALEESHQANFRSKMQKNEVDAVLSLYSLFSVAPAHHCPYLMKLLAKYFTHEESNWFAYLNDAQEFYIKGPSIEGNSVTYDMARPLLKNFFSSIENPQEHGAHLRFAHAETVIPFATMLQIPRFSDQAVHLSDFYHYDKHHWRGDRIAPMAANIQWEIYRHETDSNRILIRMLYNEIEMRFKDDCQSVSSDSFFYDLNELKRAYAHLLLPQ